MKWWNRKSLLIFVLLTFFIIPQVVSAAWWNPFSWFNNWNFSTPTSTIETQTLENRVAELEELLESKATSTNDALESVPTNKPTVNKTAEIKTSDEYKYALAPKYADGSAIAKTSAKLVSDMAGVIKEGISKINSVILVNNNIGRESSWPEFKDVIDDINGRYRVKIQYIENVLNTLAIIKQNFDELRDASNAELARVSKLPLMSQDEFNKASNNFDVINKQIYEMDAAQKKILTDYGNTLHEWAEDEKIFWNEFQEAIDYLSISLDSRPRQRYFTPVPKITTPIVPRINITNTYCRVYDNTVSCESYNY